MERELKHFSHKEHPLILKAEEHEIDDGTNHSDMENKTCYGCSKHASGPFYHCGECKIGDDVRDVRYQSRTCEGCSIPISGPFYGCEECGYFLHKVCAELPNVMNHPMHPQHPLTLLTEPPSSYTRCICDVCNRSHDRFTYHCSICEFDVDPVCASICHAIKDECHKHPLTPLQTLIPFPCHICRTEKKGLSYKCNICPFWVHQNCTLSLPSTIEYNHHQGHDLLKLLPSVPEEFKYYELKCDICADRLLMFHCIYYCERCTFYAHVSCARSKEVFKSSRSSVAFNQDGQCLAVLPVQQQSTDLISWFAENYRDRDPITNLILGFAESYTDRDTNIKKEIKFFNHNMHPLFLIDDQVSEKICDACAQPIPPPSYGCIECDYFLHKCCTELPKQILHPVHPEHQISLWAWKGFLSCDLCWQWCNGFVYRCLQCQDCYFCIDIKCASLLRPVKHEFHSHPLIPRFNSLGDCSACAGKLRSWSLKCDTCRFNLCFICAMAPPRMIHRYDKHPFKLTYFPPENHYNEYICELCLEALVPKRWHYHCGDCDQFTHLECMIVYGADSNIKYGKTYKLDDHEHKLSLVPCTYDCSFCSRCHTPLRTGAFRFGFNCRLCDFGLHLHCSSLYTPNE